MTKIKNKLRKSRVKSGKNQWGVKAGAMRNPGAVIWRSASAQASAEREREIDRQFG